MNEPLYITIRHAPTGNTLEVLIEGHTEDSFLWNLHKWFPLEDLDDDGVYLIDDYHIDLDPYMPDLGPPAPDVTQIPSAMWDFVYVTD